MKNDKHIEKKLWIGLAVVIALTLTATSAFGQLDITKRNIWVTEGVKAGTHFVIDNDTVFAIQPDTTGMYAVNGKYFLCTVKTLHDYVAAHSGAPLISGNGISISNDSIILGGTITKPVFLENDNVYFEINPIDGYISGSAGDASFDFSSNMAYLNGRTVTFFAGNDEYTEVTIDSIGTTETHSAGWDTSMVRDNQYITKDFALDKIDEKLVLLDGSGTTANGKSVNIGGALTGNADIEMLIDQSFTVNGTYSEGIQGGFLEVNTSEDVGFARIGGKNDTSQATLTLRMNSATVSGDIETFEGLQAGQDYSANYGWNSYVMKQDLDIANTANQEYTRGYVTQAIDSLDLEETVSRTIYVATTGSDETGDGSVGNPYSTILKAYQSIKNTINASVEITIDVAAGTYTVDLLAIEAEFSKKHFLDQAGLYVNGKTTTISSGFTLTAHSPEAYIYDVAGATFTTNEHQDRFVYNGTTYYPIAKNSTNTINSMVGITGTPSVVENSVIFNTGEVFSYWGNFTMNSSTFQFKNINFISSAKTTIKTSGQITFLGCKFNCTIFSTDAACQKINFRETVVVTSNVAGVTISNNKSQWRNSLIRKSGTIGTSGLTLQFTENPFISNGLYINNFTNGIVTNNGVFIANIANSHIIFDACTNAISIKNGVNIQLSSCTAYVDGVTNLVTSSETLYSNYGFYLNTIVGTPTNIAASGITTNGFCNLSKNIHIEIPSVPTSGIATLVAGTVTVNTAAVQAGTVIQLSCLTPGGTQGFLSVGTITAGTSFVVNSSSATDTSTILWQIVK